MQQNRWQAFKNNLSGAAVQIFDPSQMDIYVCSCCCLVTLIVETLTTAAIAWGCLCAHIAACDEHVVLRHVSWC